MRTLTVDDKTFELETKAAEALEQNDVLYSGSPNHDFRLNPNRKYNHSNVVHIIRAIVGVVK